MDSSTYRHLLGQLKKSCVIPHHNFPSHNLLSFECLVEVSKDFSSDVPESESEFLASFPCYLPFPYVIERNVAFYSGSGVSDDASELVKKKLSWEKKLKTLRSSNIDKAVKSVKELRAKRVVSLSKNLKKYIEHFHNDPEPVFSGSYNWLYTGGCLSYNESNDSCVLISADYLSKTSGFNLLQLNKSFDEIQCNSFSQLRTNTPVLQIASRSREGTIIICARQKNNVSLFRSDQTDVLSQPVKLWRKKVSYPKLLTCTDIKADCEEVVVVDSRHDLNVFRIENKSKSYGHSGRRVKRDSNRDAWSQVAFEDNGIYWAFRSGFVILDMRDCCSKVKLDYTSSTGTNKCEDICSFVRSPTDSNHIYFSTNHNVLQVDTRQMKTVQRWTHLMKSPPQFMTVAKGEEGSEVLVLQSQTVDEVCGIVNGLIKKPESFLSRSLPCLLKSVRESFKLAQLNGLCLSPFVSERMDFSVTGMTCLKNSENDFILFTSNSGGDVFASKITKKSRSDAREDDDVQETLRTMKIFDSHFDKVVIEPVISQLEFTKMSHMVEGTKRGKRKSQKKKKEKIYWKGHEMYSPESLMFCKDVLAQKILKVWCTDPIGATRSVDDKVLEWMNKC